MMRSLESDPEATVRKLRFATLALTGGFVLFVIGLGSMTLTTASEAAQKEGRTQAVDEETDKIRRDLREARSKHPVGAPNESKAVAAFQAGVSQLAGAVGVEVTEFLASTEVQPFLTRFAKNAEQPGWNQVEIQITLAGKATTLLQTIASLNELPIPYEFNTAQITRESVKAEEAMLKAKLQLRLIVRPGETT